MTDVEHMIAWIESSHAHYERLCQIETYRKECAQLWHNAILAHKALNIVTSAYTEATRGGDMFAEQWSARAILDAASALLEWEMKQ